MRYLFALLFFIPTLGFGFSYCIEKTVSAYPTGTTTLQELADGLTADGYKNVVIDAPNNRVTFLDVSECKEHDGNFHSEVSNVKPSSNIAKEAKP